MFLNTGMAQKHDNMNIVDVDGDTEPDTPVLSFNDMLCAIGKNKDRDSFVALFEHFAPRIKSFLMKGGADEGQADELAQETMLTVWNKAESYDPKQAAASTWIFTIARNKRIDALRKIKRIEVDFDDVSYGFEDESKSPLQNLSDTQESKTLSQAIATLPEEQAMLIRKSFFEDKSHAAIAEETGIALGTVKSRIRLALERLRRLEKVKAL